MDDTAAVLVSYGPWYVLRLGPGNLHQNSTTVSYSDLLLYPPHYKYQVAGTSGLDKAKLRYSNYGEGTLG
jgi:hypothetical protein